VIKGSSGFVEDDGQRCRDTEDHDYRVRRMGDEKIPFRRGNREIRGAVADYVCSLADGGKEKNETIINWAQDVVQTDSFLEANDVSISRGQKRR